MSSDVLHANDQIYPTKVLRMHLEEALDILLSEQILDRERAQKLNSNSGDEDFPDNDHANKTMAASQVKIRMRAMRTPICETK